MSVACQFNGRLGNILFSMATVIAYCKKHNLQWFFPTYAWACTNGQVPISVPNTGELPVNPIIYTEPQVEGHPYYHEIPYMENVEFRGYFQSFRYFEEYREDILNIINLRGPSSDMTAIHCRRGDCVNQPEGFPMVPIQYYQAAIQYMMNKGFFQFRIYSDDIPWTKEQFTIDNYPGCIFDFSEDNSDVQDFISMSSCVNLITARSTYSLMAGWFNEHPNKIVVCPSIDQHYWWLGQSKALLTGTEHWLTQLTWNI